MAVATITIASLVLTLIAAPTKAAGRHRPQHRRRAPVTAIRQLPPTGRPPAGAGAGAGADPKRSGSWPRAVRDDSECSQVVEALFSLAATGELRPNEWRVAELTGLPVRVIRHHLTDEPGLREAVRKAEFERHTAALGVIDAAASFEDRMSQFVSQRQHLYEAVALLREAELLPLPADWSQRGLNPTRHMLREHAAATFAAELGAAGRDAEAVLDGLDTATSWQSWDHLRSTVGRKPSRAARAMEMSVSRILGRFVAPAVGSGGESVCAGS